MTAAARVRVVVPVKELHLAKSRLGAALSLEARRELVLEMLERVLESASRSRAESILVVTRDRDVSALALERGIEVREDAERDLNQSLLAEFRSAWKQGAAPLYLPADLPHVDARSVDALLDCWNGDGAVVLAPAHDGGTNALLAPPACALSPCLGKRSFARHLERAERLGYETRVVRSRELALDVDTPADLDAARALA